MKTRLQKNSILCFVIALTGARLQAAPPAPAFPAKLLKGAETNATRVSTTLQAVWQEDFTLADNTTSDSGATGWTSAAAYSQAIYGVAGNEFKINNTNSYKGPVTWTSVLINIAGKSDIQLSVTARSSADVGGWLEYDDSNIYDLQLADYIRMYYKVDGGPEILFGDLRSNIKSNCGDTTVYSTGAISGATIQIIIRGRATAADEYYYFDNVTVLGTAGCTEATIPTQVFASASDRLTCNVTTVTLSGSSFTAGATYSWTGPGNFSASGPTVQTSVPGTYSFTATNSANGCFKTIPVIVAQNIAPPKDLTAAHSGPLTCTVTDVTLTASSSSPNVTYQWDGPDGYLSFSAEDIATEPGDYVLTAYNDDNGCIMKDTTTVTRECAVRRITTVPATAGTGTPAAGFEWKAYPNPYREKAFIGFKSPTADFVSVQVYGSNGIAEKQLFNNTVAPNQNYRLALDGLPAGMHYIVLRVNNKVYTGKLVSVK